MAAHVTLLPHETEDTEAFADNLRSMAQRGAAGLAKARAAAPGLMAKAGALGARAQALGSRAQALGGRMGALGRAAARRVVRGGLSNTSRVVYTTL